LYQKVLNQIGVFILIKQGIRCFIFPIKQLNWLNEMELYLSWIGSRISSIMMAYYPIKEQDNTQNNFKTLIKNGLELEDNTFSNLKVENSINEKEIIFLKEIINSNDGQTYEFFKYMYEYLKIETNLVNDNQVIINAERHIISAIIKHTNSIKLAMSFSVLISNTPKENLNDLKNKIPKKLIMIWKYSKNIRQKLIFMKQNNVNFDYNNELKNISSKSNFLLQFRDYSLIYDILNLKDEKINIIDKSKVENLNNEKIENIFDNNKNESKNENNKINEIEIENKIDNYKINEIENNKNENNKINEINIDKNIIEENFKKNEKIKEYQDQQYKILLFENKKFQNEEEEFDFIFDTSELIISFVTSSFDIIKFEEELQKTSEMAINRNNSIKFVIDLFNSTKNKEAKALVLSQVKDILKTITMKKDNEFSFHYLNNIEDVGPIISENLFDTFKNFCINLIKEIEFNEDNILSGLLRVIIETISINIKPNDIEWIIETDLLKKLIPMFYAKKIHQTNKFYLLSSKETEYIEISIKSWRLFKIISLRCFDMLENWENESNSVSNSKRNNIFDNLNCLKEKIFEYLFNEIENNLINNTNLGFIEEILSLFYSLLLSKPSKASLSTLKFKQIIIKLLKTNSNKILELILQLFSKLYINDDLGIKESNDINVDEELDDYNIDSNIEESNFYNFDKFSNKNMKKENNFKEIELNEEEIKANELIFEKIFNYLGNFILIQVLYNNNIRCVVMTF
jgi:hypothetical protein